MGGVIEAYKAEPIRCARVAETLVQLQTPGQVFWHRRWGSIIFNKY